MAEIPDDANPALDLLRSVGGDEMLAVMLATFVQFADERVPAMATEVSAGRLREAAAIAHALKASARQLGALALGDACQQMEEAGKAENAAAVADGVLVVQDRYRVAREWMRAIATAS
jgi:HPt (histidine-containing phosphotransfer) domain-containing protein